ncbi:hypothetical protein [Pseudonocardia aurantiaca]|uniref:Uncharacterized protein n=1 Tax=Pseudonocardia aurantiaca TaxID=75290 RepID=A0ABW4FN72_9PSEU
MSDAASAATLHRRAVAIAAFLLGEEAARAGRKTDAEAHFAVAARYAIGSPNGDDQDPLTADIASAGAGDRLASERLLRESSRSSRPYSGRAMLPMTWTSWPGRSRLVSWRRYLTNLTPDSSTSSTRPRSGSSTSIAPTRPSSPHWEAGHGNS